jgi:hypothetical protein
MDWQPEQPDGDRDFLDRLLAEARWAEPMPEAIDRLRGHWRRLMIRRARRRRLVSLLMAASILLTAVGLTFWLRSGAGTGQREPTGIAGKKVAPTSPQPMRQPVRVVKHQPNSLPVTKPAPAHPSTAQSSRPPNLYERLVMINHQRTRVSRPQRIESPPLEPPVEKAAERPAGQQQAAALRRQLLSLLAQNNLRSVQAFLQRVEDRRTSAVALDCLAAAPNPPVELLFRCLRGPKAAERTAAALALGHLKQAAISRQLIAMIMRGTYRQEAMIALLSSSEPTARQFVANAERSQMLSATLWNAKRQFLQCERWKTRS